MSKILGLNDCGYGILIESDSGYISFEDNKSIITEGYEPKLGEPILINCILQKYGVENKNGRIYGKDVLVPEIDRYQELVRTNSAISATDHPDSSTISLSDVSHMITKMWWGTGDDQNVLYGQIRLVVSPGFIRYGVCSVIGDKVLLYLQYKIRIGISSRGVGTLKEIRGQKYVQNDFELVGFDLVSSPSTPGAWLEPLSRMNDKNFNEPFTSFIKGLALNEKLDLETAKLIIYEYKKEKEEVK